MDSAHGELDIHLEGSDFPLIFGPRAFWRAEDAPKLYIHAAFKTKTEEAWVFWRRFEEDDYSPDNSLPFAVTPGGEYRTYTVDLSDWPTYKGAITGIGLRPTGKGGPGDRVRIKHIGFTPPE